MVGIGEQVDPVEKDVSVANVFPGTARFADTWTVNTFNAGSVDARLHYRIRSGPPAP